MKEICLNCEYCKDIENYKDSDEGLCTHTTLVEIANANTIEEDFIYGLVVPINYFCCNNFSKKEY